jgi:hypothetical protein
VGLKTDDPFPDSGGSDVSAEQEAGSDRADGPTEPVPERADSEVFSSEPADVSSEPEEVKDAPPVDQSEGQPGGEVDAEPDADAGGAADEGGGTSDAGWSPLRLPALALWLEAGVGMETDGDKVNAWVDQSPNRHRAFSQFVGLTPSLVEHGVGTHAGVAFSGTGDMLIINDAPSLRFGSRDFVLEIVFRHTTPTTHFSCVAEYGALFLKVNTHRPFNGLEVFANVDTGSRVYAGLGGALDGYNFTSTDEGVSYNDDVPRVFATFRRTDYLSLRVNGMPVSQAFLPQDGGVPLNIDAVGYDVNIGAQPDKIQCLRGVIAEIVAATDVTPSDTAALDSYLMHKYKDVLSARAAGKGVDAPGGVR